MGRRDHRAPFDTWNYFSGSTRSRHSYRVHRVLRTVIAFAVHLDPYSRYVISGLNTFEFSFFFFSVLRRVIRSSENVGSKNVR
jgi:hypothetical protein